MRRLTVLVSMMSILLTPQASAGEMLDEAVRSLRIDPVYVHPQADPTLDADAAQRLRDRISVSPIPVFIAVLPSWVADEAGGTDELPRAIGVALDRPGAVAVIAGRSFRAGASAGVGLDAGQAGRLATDSFESFHPAELGLEPMLADFVERVDATSHGHAAAPVAPPDAVRGIPDPHMEPVPWRTGPEPSPFPGFGLVFGLIAVAAIGGAISNMFRGGGLAGTGTRSSSSLSPLGDGHTRRHGTGWLLGGSTRGSSRSAGSGDWGSSSRGGSGDWGGSSGSSGSSSGGAGGGDW